MNVREEIDTTRGEKLSADAERSALGWLGLVIRPILQFVMRKGYYGEVTLVLKFENGELTHVHEQHERRINRRTKLPAGK